jgi:branched-chain amino acid transport system permease protein
VTEILKVGLGTSGAARVGPAIAAMLIYVVMAAVLAVRPAGLFAARG